MIAVILGGGIAAIAIYELFIKKKTTTTISTPSATTTPPTSPVASVTASIPVPSVAQSPAEIYVPSTITYSEPSSQASPPSNPNPTIDPSPAPMLNLPNFSATPGPLPTVANILGVAQSTGNALAAAALPPPPQDDPNRSVSVANMNTIGSPAMAAMAPVMSSPTNSPAPISNPAPLAPPPAPHPSAGIATALAGLAQSSPLAAMITPFAGWRDASGNLRLLTAVTDQENKILTYMKQNKNSAARFPTDVGNWLVSHGIARSRVQ